MDIREPKKLVVAITGKYQHDRAAHDMHRGKPVRIDGITYVYTHVGPRQATMQEFFMVVPPNNCNPVSTKPHFVYWCGYWHMLNWYNATYEQYEAAYQWQQRVNAAIAQRKLCKA